MLGSSLLIGSSSCVLRAALSDSRRRDRDPPSSLPSPRSPPPASHWLDPRSRRRVVLDPRRRSTDSHHGHRPGLFSAIGAVAASRPRSPNQDALLRGNVLNFESHLSKLHVFFVVFVLRESLLILFFQTVIINKLYH